MRAWSEMFNTFLAEHRTGESSAARSTAADTSPYTDADYFAHVDGKPRYDGVRDFLTSRGIRLLRGDGPSGACGRPQERCLPGGARPRRGAALPRVGRSPRPPEGAGPPARRRLLVRERRGGARGCGSRRSVRHRRGRDGRADSKSPGQAGARHLPARGCDPGRPCTGCRRGGGRRLRRARRCCRRVRTRRGGRPRSRRCVAGRRCGDRGRRSRGPDPGGLP